MAKTKEMEFLDAKGVKYEALPHSKEAFSVEDVARERKRPLDQLVKCLLLVSKDRKYVIACLLGHKRVDRHKVRELMGYSKTGLAPEDELKTVVGCEIGALSPLSALAAGKEIPVVFDSSIAAKEKVNISSGDLKAGLEVASKDLIALVSPRQGDIAQEESRSA